MSLTLSVPKTISEVQTQIKINSFAVDLDRKEIHIAYSELGSDNNVLAEKGLTIVEPDFTQAITDASVTAGVDIYSPLKVSLYNQIQLATLVTGLVS